MMKIEKSEISTKLDKLKVAVHTKSQNEALRGVLFKNNQLTAYNFEYGIHTRLDVDTEEQFIIPLKAIEMIQALPDGIIEITSAGAHQIQIKTGAISNKFSGMIVEDFPDIPIIELRSGTITIPGEKLEKALASLLYAVPAKSSRQILTGILFDARAGYLNLVGCDGFRMAWNRFEFDKEFRHILPKETIMKLISLSLKGDVEISFDQRRAIFKSSDYSVFTRLMEGEYVDYMKYFPKHTNTTSVDLKALLNSVHRAMICMDNKIKAIIKLSFDRTVMRLTLNSAISEYDEYISLNEELSSPLEIGFNIIYLYDTLRSFDCSTLKIGLGSSVMPMTISDGNQAALVVPSRL